MPGAEDNHGGAAIEGVARSHNLSARLERVPGGQGAIVRLLEDGKDGSNRDQTINVGAAI